ncbi:MAM and LDL-receptor class A domain-containing protein 1-like isoform X2 [Corticium candelabrum]|uniref:MAM and LDL-receptor class A domain-containing protein 1-like isoform X2 n=1 Tax=Corticium candelabrum TaxID=121492 RepID=UPI002E2600FF|nr:MAM and LDL-receptor class A domain-containing protein 1-like isoform X2 [Corticium candelabrum]
MRHPNAAWQRWRVIVTTLITFSTISESAKTTCDFESGFCGWKNLPRNDLNWRLMSGSTPSVGTGPTTDHTKGTSLGRYVYIETSGKSNAQAVLASSAVTNSNQATCKLSMAYHMYGSEIGKLEVIAHTTYRNSSVWSRFGSQSNLWLTTTVDFGSITGSFEIYVRASHSSGFKGDVALDDLLLTNCPPGFPLHPPTLFPPQPFPNTKCSFETNLCVWSNDVSNDVDWVMRQGRTPSSQTGPTDDHTYQNRSGKYIYFEVTSAGYSSHAALVSPKYLKSGSACRMQFAYHFYGINIGDMHVYFVTNKNRKIHNLLSTTGNQGNVWHMRSVFIGPQTDFKIYFNGTHYSGYQGDMALDDISFLGCDPNPQTGYPTTDAMTTSTPTAAKRFVSPCFPPASSIADGSVRLADGNTSNEGRVEIYHSRRWGTVCSDNWTSTNGRVICSGSIWMDDVRCSAGDLRLQHCSFRGWGSHNCDHSDDVGVICESPIDGDVRLVNGYTANAGRVEIYHNGEWGSVCADFWSMNEANVVCKQLGYSCATALSSHGQGCGKIWMSNINCHSGWYSRLDDCSFSGWGIRSCNHSRYASVICDTLVPTTDWWWWHTTSPPGKDDKSRRTATPIIVEVTVYVISAVLVFAIFLIVIIGVRRRQATTITTTTTSAQVSAGQPAQAQSVSFVPSAYLNVTYPSLQFNSNELGASPSYETVIGYRSDSQTVNFGEMNQHYVA